MALLVAQVAPKVAPALVHLPTCVHCAAVVQGVLAGARLLVQTPTKSQSVFTRQARPSFGLLLFVHVFGPTAGQLALALHAVAGLFEHVPVSGQFATPLGQSVAGALLQ